MASVRPGDIQQGGQLLTGRPRHVHRAAAGLCAAMTPEQAQQGAHAGVLAAELPCRRPVCRHASMAPFSPFLLISHQSGPNGQLTVTGGGSLSTMLVTAEQSRVCMPGTQDACLLPSEQPSGCYRAVQVKGPSTRTFRQGAQPVDALCGGKASVSHWRLRPAHAHAAFKPAFAPFRCCPTCKQFLQGADHTNKRGNADHCRARLHACAPCCPCPDSPLAVALSPFGWPRPPAAAASLGRTPQSASPLLPPRAAPAGAAAAVAPAVSDGTDGAARRASELACSCW